MTRYLVTGAGGMLAQDLLRILRDRAEADPEIRIDARTRAELDITDAAAVDAAVADADVVLNAAAYTAVDKAEEDEDAAYAINATGVENLARAAARHGATLVHYSTDYVFHGDGTSPYAEDAPRDPLNAYGRTKAAGEQLALAANPDATYVLRTAWIYGLGGPNFAKTMVKLAGSHPEVTVVDDQLGQPTSTADLAAQTFALLDAHGPAGIYHATNSGECTWFEFAQAIFAEAGLDPERVKPTDSSSFVRPAARPAYSVLGHDRWAAAGIAPMRPWREALADAAREGVLTPEW